jgi:hypothetical protein
MIIGKAISPFAIKRRNGGNDADAQAFITASGISGTNATATNQLVLDLKAANIWTKMKAVYPMVGGTATSCKWNLVNPVDSNAAFRLVFSGGGTFSSAGYLPNGTNAYGNTFLTPSINLSLNNASLSIYSRTNNTSLGFDIGVRNTISGSDVTLTMYAGGALVGRINTYADYASIPLTNTLGFIQSTRVGINSQKVFKNATSSTSTITTSTAAVSFVMLIGALNQNGTATFFNNKEIAFASIGDGLTDTEALAFYNAVNSFQVTLGRNV